MQSTFKKLFLVVTLSLFFSGTAHGVTTVPAGNRNNEQPAVPGASAKRTRELSTSYAAKYAKIYNLLKTDNKLRARIVTTAKDYGINPVHIAGAIVGEHTYNVDVYDRLQTYYVKGMSYLNQGVKFSYEGEDVTDFVNRPQFSSCSGFSDSYRLWTCRETIWDKNFRGKTVNGKKYPNNRFSAVFFQPFFAGQTFGLGQVNPLTALMMSDRVNRISGLPKLSAQNGGQVYKTIMDPDQTIPYIAATIRQSIDVYRQIADFDISGNPGLTATLYNTGGAEARARALAEENKRAIAHGEPIKLPQENYYGWFVNSKLDDLEKLF
ncbi:DUF1402 family protein [uncultured Bartonella sp.]|uniref:DUF1402 family protein n=1 Tax=uncultured Bartonella sp. TaxID=104108 RepID=UPI0026390EF3|nr:DUF1402 family protein [uncultured Bartonella sp.]